MADLVITAANVLAGSDAITGSGIAGATITAGQTLYQDASDSNELKPADSNAGASTSAAVGIALHAALTGQPIKYVKSGSITIGATVAVGTIYVVSNNAGGIAPSSDLAQGWYTTILGIATTTAIIDVSIKSGGVAVPAP